MVECSWLGLIGYIVAFLLFLWGGVSGILDMVQHIIFGFRKSFFFKYKNDMINNPITNIIFFGFMAGISIYIVSIYLIPIIIRYWKCLG